VTSIIHDQRKMHSRSGATPVGWRGCAPIPAREQGEPRSRFVGIASSFSRSGISHCLTCLPVNWRGLRAPSFSLCFAGGLQTRHRRLALPLLPERGADKFSRRLTESRAHQLRISRKPGSDRADPLHRSTSSCVVGFNTDEHKRETTWNGPLPDKNSPRRTRSAPA
jgi:hypothetical protein